MRACIINALNRLEGTTEAAKKQHEKQIEKVNESISAPQPSTPVASSSKPTRGTGVIRRGRPNQLPFMRGYPVSKADYPEHYQLIQLPGTIPNAWPSMEHTAPDDPSGTSWTSSSPSTSGEAWVQSATWKRQGPYVNTPRTDHRAARKRRMLRTLKENEKLLQESIESQLQGVEPVEIHNLTDIPLTPMQKNCLSFGLNFIQTPKMPNSEVLNEAIRDFVRTSRIRYIFAHSEKPIPRYRKKSTWNPTPDDSHFDLERQLYHLENELEDAPRQNHRSNWTKQFNQELDSLLDRKDTMIITCDKNLGYCLVKVSWYIDRVMDHLGTANNYEDVTSNFIQKGDMSYGTNIVYDKRQHLIEV